jgi:site-specific DNA recombinase
MNAYDTTRSNRSGAYSQRTAVIYTRVSNDRAEGRSVEEQEADCRAACAREGWPIRLVITDNDYSATRYKRTERPGYVELQKVLRPGDVLVTWESSRGYRDLEDYLTIRTLCETRHVLLNYSGRTYDLTEGEDRFTTGLDALIAERYAEETRKRIIRGTQANLAAGKPHGKVPYGYKAIRDPDTGKVVKRVPHPVEANVIREIYRRLLGGETQRSVCNDLNKRGVLPAGGDRWHVSTIKQLALRPSVAGMRSHYGEIVTEGTWEPIVTLDEYRRLEAILRDKERTKYFRGTEPVHLLSGIAICDVCKDPVWHSKTKGPKRKRDGIKPINNRYRCTKGHLSRAAEMTDAVVERVMVLLLEDERVIARLEKTDDTAAVAAREQAEALRAHMEGQIEAIVDQGLPPAMTAKALARLNETLMPQIEDAEARSKQSASNPLLHKLSGPNAGERWAALTVMEKRDAIRAALDITILKAGVRQNTFDPETIDVEWRV